MPSQNQNYHFLWFQLNFITKSVSFLFRKGKQMVSISIGKYWCDAIDHTLVISRTVIFFKKWAQKWKNLYDLLEGAWLLWFYFFWLWHIFKGNLFFLKCVGIRIDMWIIIINWIVTNPDPVKSQQSCFQCVFFSFHIFLCSRINKCSRILERYTDIQVY